MYSRVRKIDNRYVVFNPEKISNSITRALVSTNTNGVVPDDLTEEVINILPEYVKYKIASTEEIAKAVEFILMDKGCSEAAKAYILYREERIRAREGKSSLMQAVEEITTEYKKDNSNTPPGFSAKVFQVSEMALIKYNMQRVLSKESAEAHINGDIHIHDSFAVGLAFNCLYIPIRKLLLNGFSTGTGPIRPPRRPDSIFALAAIVFQSAQNDAFGGMAMAHFDEDIAEVLRQNCKGGFSDKELFQAVEGFIYNLNTLSSRFAAQRPFSSIGIGTDISPEGRAVTKAILDVMELGMDGLTFIWPNILFKIKSGINYEPGTPNHDLLIRAMEVSAKRLNPTYIFCDTTFNKSYTECISSMGCRTRVSYDVHGINTQDGRGNISFTTINLPRIALESNGNENRFFEILNERMNLVEKQLIERLELVGKLKKKDFAFIMGQHLYAESDKLKENDDIYPCLIHGTQSIGFCGLDETIKILTGNFMWESDSSWELGYKIIKFMRGCTDNYTKKHNLNFTLFQTPAESASGRFCRLDKERFGEIEDVTDKDFYTNSSHMAADAPLTVVDKIKKEAPFHALTNAGHICHLYLSSPPLGNVEAIKQIIDCAYESDIGYLAVNYAINECLGCGFGDPITRDKCPKCGSENINRLARITGYISPINIWNDGKLAELKRRPDGKGNKN
ncbi:MAG: anaerobic ribonucleoside-triphosphate reductase [Phycisphaerae bacterium]|jgi:ribonucleoside-triphosphate reductase